MIAVKFRTVVDRLFITTQTFNDTFIGFTEEMDGTILAYSANKVYKLDSSTFLHDEVEPPESIVETNEWNHNNYFSNFSGLSLFADYESEGNIRLDAYLNNEINVRSGNSKLFVKENKYDESGFIYGSIYDKMRLKLVFPSGGVRVLIKNFGWKYTERIIDYFKGIKRNVRSKRTGAVLPLPPTVFEIIKLTLAGDHFLNTTTIEWDTEIPSTSQVEYGLTNSYGYETVVDSKLVKNHRVIITGIDNRKKYHYRAKSTAVSLFAMSGDYVFPNWDDFLTIKNVSGGYLNSDKILIGWGTNRPATSKVLWGFTEALGNETQLDVEHVKSHLVEILNTVVDVTLYFKVQSTTHDGYIATSDIYFFTIGKEKDVFIQLYYELLKSKILVNKAINMTVEFPALENDATLIPDAENEEFVELSTEKITVNHNRDNEVSIGTEYTWSGDW